MAAKTTTITDKKGNRTSLYGRLGVQQDADLETIKHAYHDIAKKNHPDKQKQNNMANITGVGEIDFSLITEAYEVLQDPVKRKEYSDF